MTALITSDGLRITASDGLAIAPSHPAFVYSFQGPDGPLPSGVDGHDWDPTMFEPIGQYQGSAVIADATARVGANYGADQFAIDPGEQYVGIGCHWWEMGTDSVYVGLLWSGLTLTTAGRHVEAAPCVHFVPGTIEHAYGLWPSTLTLSAISPIIFWLGGIGAPPETFLDHLYGVGQMTHAAETPREIGLLTNGAHVTCWKDGPPWDGGTQIQINPTALAHAADASIAANVPTYAPIPVPPNLVGSTLHGLEFDCHFCSPPYADWTDIPTIPVANRIEIRPQ